MPNFFTKLKNWFCPPRRKPQPPKRKAIKSQSQPEPIKDPLTYQQRLKSCKRLIAKLTKDKEGKC